MRSVHFNKSGVCGFQHPISPSSSLLRLSYTPRMTFASHSFSWPTDYDRPWTGINDRTSIDEEKDILTIGFKPRFSGMTRASSVRLRNIRNGARKKRFGRPKKVRPQKVTVLVDIIAARSMEKI